MLGRLTALARVLDPAVASNRFALLAAAGGVLLGGLGAALAGTEDVAATLGAGLRYGVGVLLAWAIARELDPDRPRAARYAAFVYAPAALVGPPDLVAVVALLLAARTTGRTTGLAPRGADLVALPVLAGLAARTGPGFVCGMAVAAACYLERELTGRDADTTPSVRRALVAAAAAALLAVAATTLTGAFLGGWHAPATGGLVLVAAGAIAAVWMGPATVEARADVTRVALSPRRLAATRWLVLATLAGALAWAGGAAVGALAPAISAVVGVALAARARTRARATQA